jgi:hypothetical protein
MNGRVDGDLRRHAASTTAIFVYDLGDLATTVGVDLHHDHLAGELVHRNHVAVLV